ncbi:MAG: NepR family anti-sigma factor [Sphingomonas sp.]
MPERRSSKGGKPGTDGNKSKKVKDEAMGTALRTVYHDAVSEPVPDEMLDLLRKLG